MERFMIGQYGNFSHEKQVRDFKDNFFGIEACLFECGSDIQELISTAQKGQFNIGVHFPLRTGIWRLRDPQFLSKDDEIKRSSYEYIEKEVDFLKDIKPKYILFHYPKPVILDEHVDWTNWRFDDKTEYYFESEYSFEEFRMKSEEFFKWLDYKGKKNNFIPVLELDALNRYIYDSDLLETLLQRFSSIRICLDIGRLHLQDKLDKNFSALDVTRRFAKYAEAIHLWNVKVSNKIEFSHYPVLPNLSPEDGWADVETYLRIIKEENKTCKILFEHNSKSITDEELESCYNWVNNLLNT
ncbi:hypothetical protein [Caloranaerobacter ferrireducens]|uniref:hypothetical protein n=1 Tax=Caloranaerobacter ferrireducens TaxID=1323370 RepID=UPI00084D3CC9|nr:hypothetical protein [Caloranaerobacter ferrireducens]